MNDIINPTSLGIQQTHQATIETQDLIWEAHQDVRKTLETVQPLSALLSLLERPDDQAEALGSHLAESLAGLATAISEITVRTSQLEKAINVQTELLSRISKQSAERLKASDHTSQQVAEITARLDQLHQDLFADG